MNTAPPDYDSLTFFCMALWQISVDNLSLNILEGANCLSKIHASKFFAI
jgi:hypothetical protein